MNILIVHNYYKIPGGEDIVVRDEMAMLKMHGHRVFTYFRNNKDIDNLGIAGKLKLSFDTIFSFKTYKDIKKIIKKHRIEVVHVHNTLPLVSPAVYYAALSCKVPVVQTVHNFRLLCPAGTLYRDNHVCEDCINNGLGCSLKHKCYRESFAQTFISVLSMRIHRMTGMYKKINYICLTEFNKNKLLGLSAETGQFRKSLNPLGLSDSQIFVKPNFTKEDISEISIDSDKKKAASTYIVIGRLEKLKGIDVILKAWKILGSSAPKLVLCGTGDLEKKAKAYAEKYNLTSVDFKGFVDNNQVKELLKSATAMIFAPQCYEGFGIVVAESFMCGTPVIVGDIGNPGILVSDGVNGKKFEYNSPEALAKTVQEFENMDLEEYKKLSAGAREEYGKYTEEVNYKILEEIYKKIAD